MPWPTISAIGKVHISGIQLAVNSVIAIPMVQCSVEAGFVFSMAYSYKSNAQGQHARMAMMSSMLIIGVGVHNACNYNLSS